MSTTYQAKKYLPLLLIGAIVLFAFTSKKKKGSVIVLQGNLLPGETSVTAKPGTNILDAQGNVIDTLIGYTAYPFVTEEEGYQIIKYFTNDIDYIFAKFLNANKV